MVEGVVSMRLARRRFARAGRDLTRESFIDAMARINGWVAP